MNKINTKKISIQSFLAILGVGFGLLIAAQFHSIPSRVTNPVLPYTSLKQTKEELYTEQSDLKSSIMSLQGQIEKSQNDIKNSTLSEQELNQLDNKKAQAGLVKLSGQGIIINLDDAKNQSASEDSIIHAADLRDTINVLWASGAEAISINDQRIVLDTAIDCIVNTILINNERIAAPFIVKAIGDKNTLFDGVTHELPALDKRSKQNGLIFNVNQINSIIIPAYDGSFNINMENNNV